MPHDIKHPDDIFQPSDMVNLWSCEKVYCIWLYRWMSVSKNFHETYQFHSQEFKKTMLTHCRPVTQICVFSIFALQL
jgi:hypothetical protein